MAVLHTTETCDEDDARRMRNVANDWEYGSTILCRKTSLT